MNGIKKPQRKRKLFRAARLFCRLTLFFFDKIRNGRCLSEEDRAAVSKKLKFFNDVSILNGPNAGIIRQDITITDRWQACRATLTPLKVAHSGNTREKVNYTIELPFHCYHQCRVPSICSKIGPGHRRYRVTI